MWRLLSVLRVCVCGCWDGNGVLVWPFPASWSPANTLKCVILWHNRYIPEFPPDVTRLPQGPSFLHPYKLPPSCSSLLGLSLYGRLFSLNIWQRRTDEVGASLRGGKSHQNCRLFFCTGSWETYIALKEKWKKKNKGTEKRNNFRCCSLHSAAGPPASCVCSGTCV